VSQIDLQQRFRGCLLGLAVGDAVGTTVEFQRRGSFPPVTDMVGRGSFHLQPGQWTDDTSMALCLGTSLVEMGTFDAGDQMNRYCQWREQGYLSSTGTCFDIGIIVSQALTKYQISGHPFSRSTNPRSAGNGCLMRLAPIPMFYFSEVDRHPPFFWGKLPHHPRSCGVYRGKSPIWRDIISDSLRS